MKLGAAAQAYAQTRGGAAPLAPRARRRARPSGERGSSCRRTPTTTPTPAVCWPIWRRSRLAAPGEAFAAFTRRCRSIRTTPTSTPTRPTPRYPGRLRSGARVRRARLAAVSALRPDQRPARPRRAGAAPAGRSHSAPAASGRWRLARRGPTRVAAASNLAAAYLELGGRRSRGRRARGAGACPELRRRAIQPRSGAGAPRPSRRSGGGVSSALGGSARTRPRARPCARWASPEPGRARAAVR